MVRGTAQYSAHRRNTGRAQLTGRQANVTSFSFVPSFFPPGHLRGEGHCAADALFAKAIRFLPAHSSAALTGQGHIILWGTRGSQAVSGIPGGTMAVT